MVDLKDGIGEFVTCYVSSTPSLVAASFGMPRYVLASQLPVAVVRRVETALLLLLCVDLADLVR